MTKETRVSASEGETTLKLKEICGVHPRVQGIRTEGCGNLRDLPTGVFSARGLLDIAHSLPLQVVMHKGKYLCVGRLPLFRLLQICASPDTDIPVFIHSRLSRKQLENFIRMELIVIPAFFAIRNKDVGRLGAVWARHSASEFFTRILNNPGSQALAALLGCDKRTILERQHENTSQQQSTAVKEGEEAWPRASVEENERALIRGASQSATPPQADAAKVTLSAVRADVNEAALERDECNPNEGQPPWKV